MVHVFGTATGVTELAMIPSRSILADADDVAVLAKEQRFRPDATGYFDFTLADNGQFFSLDGEDWQWICTEFGPGRRTVFSFSADLGEYPYAVLRTTGHGL
jgi:hypothetical protein